MDDLRDLSRQREQERDREEMHDTAHDHRLKVGPDTSVSVNQKDGGPMLDLKHNAVTVTRCPRVPLPVGRVVG